MTAFGNLVWLVLCGGLWAGLAWLLAGALLHLTVIGIPFGRACWRIAGFAFFPFGKELIDARLVGESRVAGTAAANLLWFVLAGWWLALAELAAAASCIIACLLVFPVFFGAPVWAVAHFNLAKASFAPLGKRAVPKQEATAARIAHQRRLAEKIHNPA